MEKSSENGAPDGVGVADVVGRLVLFQDLGEHGIAPAQITTTQPFASRPAAAAATTMMAPWDKAKAVNAQTALIPGDNLLDELIAPAR